MFALAEILIFFPPASQKLKVLSITKCHYQELLLFVFPKKINQVESMNCYNHFHHHHYIQSSASSY